MSGNRQMIQWEDSRLLIRLADGAVYVLDTQHLHPHRVHSLEQRKADVDKLLSASNTAGTVVEAVLIPVAYAANAVVEPPPK